MSEDKSHITLSLSFCSLTAYYEKHLFSSMVILHVCLWEEEIVQIGYPNLSETSDLFFYVKHWGSMMIKLYTKQQRMCILFFCVLEIDLVIFL